MTAPDNLWALALNQRVKTQIKAEMARHGLLFHQLAGYEDPERGWLRPIDDPDVQVSIRSFLSALERAVPMTTPEPLASAHEKHQHCGCCGRCASGTGQLSGDWCGQCRGHVLPTRHPNYIPPWDRTYLAQHGTDCPFVASTPTTEKP